jgi:hypothetical protein
MNILKKWWERRKAFKLALQFNKRYTFIGISRNKLRWMCPSCNEVHYTTGWSPFVGGLFPACCEFTKGHRLDKEHATKG